MFGADFLLATELAKPMQFDLKPRRQNIGAIIGSACHEAAAFIMTEIKETGSQREEAIQTAIELAESHLENDFQDVPRITYDKTTRSQGQAILQPRPLITTWAKNLKVTDEPIIIEKGYKATIDGNVEVTGTVDQFLMGGRLIDLKFGRNSPKAISQMGCYIAILIANGFDVRTAEVHWTKRSPQKRAQPPTEIIPIKMKVAQQQALSVIKNAKRAIEALLDSNSPFELVANSACRLCSANHCPAWGTNFCYMGHDDVCE